MKFLRRRAGAAGRGGAVRKVGKRGSRGRDCVGVSFFQVGIIDIHLLWSLGIQHEIASSLKFGF